MNIAFGHTSMDMDCFGSLILVKKLYPDYQLIRSRLIHPTARSLYGFYRDLFQVLLPKDIEGEKIDNIIIVDTCAMERVKEYFACIHGSDPDILIIDHHPQEQCDILGARHGGRHMGSNTTLLALEAMEKGIVLEPEEATIALTGIYADTGQLIYDHARPEDFQAAAYLVSMGASLKMVKSFLQTIKEDDQVAILQQLVHITEKKDIQGHSILFSYLELDENIPGLNVVVEKVMDIESPDAYFAIFAFPEKQSVLLIARSQKLKIDLHQILNDYGGGGHQSAGSAKIEHTDGQAFYAEFCDYLDRTLAPATRAKDIMTKQVRVINENKTLLEASLFLEEIDHTGVPVVNDRDELSGFITLRDIMKGRRESHMQSPVKQYMSKKLITIHPDATSREIERTFFKYDISHLPVVDEANHIEGLITSWDFLQFRKRQITSKGISGQKDAET
jgi:tRNA nucleotidyltransferase (CCA-adding enzyme)